MMGSGRASLPSPVAPRPAGTTLVPGSRHLITPSGHDIHHEQPELVLDAIRDVVHAVRSDELVPH
jgi:pimeloyl-ACP methyl ester carboxylesterase